MSHGERGDGPDEFALALHQNQQREHEQQMIDAKKNVLDAEDHIRTRDLAIRRARPRPRTTAKRA